jgi:hypothetical protein
MAKRANKLRSEENINFTKVNHASFYYRFRCDGGGFSEKVQVIPLSAVAKESQSREMSLKIVAG